MRHARGLRRGLAAGWLVGASWLAMAPALAMDLTEAVSRAVNENPTIGEAVENRRATYQELEQARGLYLPQVDVLGSIGPGLRDSRDTRLAGTDDNWFIRRELSVTLQQLIFDGFATDAEIERQAARVDAAAYRVLERSELIGLDVVEAYLDVLRQIELVDIGRENVAFHERTRGLIRDLVQGGIGPQADLQQGEERLEGARVLSVDIARSLEESQNRFRRLVGSVPDELIVPEGAAGAVPLSLEDALASAATGNPTLKLARSDVDSAKAELKGAESRFYPSLGLEVTGRTGEDLDGDNTGRDTDVRALLVLRYNIFRGGIDTANRQEQVFRQAETERRLASRQREVEELMRNAWSTLERVRERTALLARQVDVSERLLNSYREEYRVGRRALLDILDAQNALVQTRVDFATSRYALMLAEYRVLAISGRLLASLDVVPPREASPLLQGE